MPNPHLVIFAKTEVIIPDFISIFRITKYQATVINNTLGEQYKKNNSICRSVISGFAVMFLNP